VRLLTTGLVVVVVVALVIGVATWGQLRNRRVDALERWAETQLMDAGLIRVPRDSALLTRAFEPRPSSAAPVLWVRQWGLGVEGHGAVAAAFLTAAGRARVAEHIHEARSHLARVASYTKRRTGPAILLVEQNAPLHLVRTALDALEAAGEGEVVVAFLVPPGGWMRELEESEVYRRYVAIPEDAHGGRDLDAISTLVRSTQPFCPAIWEVFDNWHMAPPDMKSMYGVYSTAEATRRWLCLADIDGVKALLWATLGEQPVGGPEVRVKGLRQSLRVFPDSARWGEVLEAEGDDGEAAGGDDTAGHGVRPTFQWPER